MRRALLAALAVALIAPAAASAHATMTGATPAEQGRVETSPNEITLRFDQSVVAPADAIVVLGADGRDHAGAIAQSHRDTVVRAHVTGLVAGEAYTVRWRIVSADGHVATSVFASGSASIPTADRAVGGGGSTRSPNVKTPVATWPRSPPNGVGLARDETRHVRAHDRVAMRLHRLQHRNPVRAEDDNRVRERDDRLVGPNVIRFGEVLDTACSAGGGPSGIASRAPTRRPGAIGATARATRAAPSSGVPPACERCPKIGATSRSANSITASTTHVAGAHRPARARRGRSASRPDRKQPTRRRPGLGHSGGGDAEGANSHPFCSWRRNEARRRGGPRRSRATSTGSGGGRGRRRVARRRGGGVECAKRSRRSRSATARRRPAASDGQRQARHARRRNTAGPTGVPRRARRQQKRKPPAKSQCATSARRCISTLGGQPLGCATRPQGYEQREEKAERRVEAGSTRPIPEPLPLGVEERNFDTAARRPRRSRRGWSNGPSASTARAARSVFRAARGSSAVWAREVTSSFTAVRVASRSLLGREAHQAQTGTQLPRENAVGGDLPATGAEIPAGKWRSTGAVRRLRGSRSREFRPDEVGRDKQPASKRPSPRRVTRRMPLVESGPPSEKACSPRISEGVGDQSLPVPLHAAQHVRAVTDHEVGARVHDGVCEPHRGCRGSRRGRAPSRA